MSERDFSKHWSFTSYTYVDHDSGETFKSPFPTAVVGISDELLGVGRIIGAVSSHAYGDSMPVIAIDDDTADGGVVELLGVECFWTPGVDPEASEVLATDRAAGKIMSASTYVEIQALDEEGDW